MGQVLRLYHKSLDYKDLQILQQLCVYIAMLRCLKMNHLVSSNESTICSADGQEHNENKGMFSMLVGSLWFCLWYIYLKYLGCELKKFKRRNLKRCVSSFQVQCFIRKTSQMCSGEGTVLHDQGLETLSQESRSSLSMGCLLC